MTPTVLKTAQSTANCSVEATYQVVVSNNSTVDTLTINSLNDDKFGDVTPPMRRAAVSQRSSARLVTRASRIDPIDPQGNYTCGFVGKITSASCDFSHTNTVTADVTDDDDVNSTPSDDAIVAVDATP